MSWEYATEPWLESSWLEELSDVSDDWPTTQSLFLRISVLRMPSHFMAGTVMFCS